MEDDSRSIGSPFIEAIIMDLAVLRQLTRAIIEGEKRNMSLWNQTWFFKPFVCVPLSSY